MNDLMKKLANAKKIMDKVDSGNFIKGQINEEILLNSPEDFIKNNSPKSHTNNQYNQTIKLEQTQFQSNQQPLNIDKIQQSKLPDAIKKAMIERPIQQISLMENKIDSKIIEGAKRLINEESKEQQLVKPKSQSKNTIDNIPNNQLVSLIENIVRKTVTEILDNKLNEFFKTQDTMTINENLVLKVGDSVFKGKITGVNKR